MLRSHATQASYDRGLEASRYALLEGSEPVLEEGPAGLDRTEIRRVRGKKEQACSRFLHQGADLRRMVGAKVVEHDNVARIQSWDEPTADEVDELRPVDGAVEGLVNQDAVGTYGADDADVLSPIGRRVIDDALTTRRPTVGRRHGAIAARLVDEDQPVRRDVLDLIEVVDALCLDVAAELFRRAETLFFRVTPARWRDRSMLERLRCTPWRVLHSSFSWSRVASGISATSRSNSGELVFRNPRRKSSARRFRNDVAQLALTPKKPGNRRLTNAKALRQLEVRALIALVRSDDPAPQIQGQRIHHQL